MKSDLTKLMYRTLCLVVALLLAACGGGSTSYTVGGRVAGLSGTLVLQNNHGDNLTVTSNDTFTFTKPVASGSAYNVMVLTQPAGHICSVANGTGTVSSAAVTNVAVSCASTGRLYSIGINTNGATDWNDDIPFADAMKTHRYWQKLTSGMPTMTVGDGLDANGWPTQDGRVLVWDGLTTHHNDGTYKLTFTGSATVSIAISNTSVVLQNTQYNSSTNTTSADLVINDPTNQVLYLDFTGTTGGVRNVKLMRPLVAGGSTTHDPSVVVSQDYKNKLAPFTTIRFMGWLGATVDNTNEISWSQRLPWTYATQTQVNHNVVSWESVIKIANETGKDPWINIPNRADDDYIQHVADLFKNGNADCAPLRSDLHLYIEYSNEIWNWAQPQTDWAYNTAAPAEAAKPGSPLAFDGETDKTTWMMRFKAMRSVQISNIFRGVFGDTEMMMRIRPVIAWQIGYNDLTNRTLSFVDRYYNKRDSRSTWSDPHPVNYYIYGGGASGYWYTDDKTQFTYNSSTGCSSDLWSSGSWVVANYKPTIFKDAAWAKAFGLAYLAYEGDNHPAYSNNDDKCMTPLHWNAQMGPTTQAHLQAFASVDGELFNFLVLNNHDPVWGVLNEWNPSNSPQYDVISTLSGAVAEPLATGSMVPFTRAGASFDTLTYEDPAPSSTGTLDLAANQDGYAASYDFRTASTGTVNIQVQLSATVASTIMVEVDGAVSGTYSVTNTSGVVVTTPSYAVTSVADKLHSVRLVCTKGAVKIKQVSGT